MSSSLAVLNRVKSLKKLRAQARLKKTASKTQWSKLGLLEAVPKLNRKYAEPRHLLKLVRWLEQVWSTGGVRVTAHAPPRHGKTELVLVAIALTLARHPDWTVAYVTYEQNIARSKSRKVRDYCAAMGLEFADDENRLAGWRLKQGGGLLAVGVGGPLTGQGVNLLIVDDPYKNRKEAESDAHRQTIKDWWNDVATTRLEPGASAIVFHTRWVKDDLIGHLHEQEPGIWTHLLMPAVNNNGEALWPQRWSIEALRKKQIAVGPYTWASLFQGDPQPRGQKVFRGVFYYTERPSEYTVGIGIDCAYTTNTRNDTSAAVVFALEHATGKGYLLEVLSGHYEPAQWAEELLPLVDRYPGVTWRWHLSGTERSGVTYLVERGIPVEGVPAVTDKFTRAIPVSADWNAGKVMVPQGAAWVPSFLKVLHAFTGKKDKRDDDVDALSSARDAAHHPTSIGFSICA